MKTRMLGTLEVSALGYGCMGLDGAYNAPVPRSEGVDLIRAAYDRGVTLFDTADAIFQMIKDAGKDWDGSEPLRKLG